MNIPIKQIKVDRSSRPTGRARADFGDIQRLATSIKEHGLLHPVIVDHLPKPDGDKLYVLIAGERRIRAAAFAGLPNVEAKLIKDTTELDRKAMEMEENVARKELTWMEKMECVSQLHIIRQMMYGAATHSKTSTGWGVRQTAESLGMSVGSVATDVKLASDLKEHPELVGKIKKLPKPAAKKVVEQTIDAQRLQMLVDSKQLKITSNLRLGNCCKLIDELADGSVDCLLTDPPFANPMIVKTGVTDKASFNLTSSNVSTWEVMLPVYKKLIPKLARKLKPGAHVYIFNGMGDVYSSLMSILRENGFLMDDLPLIWSKCRTTVVAKDFHYMSSYEAIIFGHNQERTRSLWKPRPNVLDYPAIAPQMKVHGLQKPLDLLRMLIENSTSPGEIVLDCFSGSGSTLKAARIMQRRAIGFELDKGNYLRALEWLNDDTKGQHKEADGS